MEMYIYKCKDCGFSHCIPAYWVSFSPESEVEMQHLNFETKEFCPCEKLDYVGTEGK